MLHVFDAVVFTPLSQYLVQPPFAAITDASVLGYASTRFAHLEIEMFVHSFLFFYIFYCKIRDNI